MASQLLQNLTEKLHGCGIHTLRQLGRAVGVYSPTNKKKEELIEDILAIATNRADPVVNESRRGAPPKSDEYDRTLLSDIERCRSYYSGLTLAETREELPVSEDAVCSPELADDEDVYAGVLENDQKSWFIRIRDNAFVSRVHIGSEFINRFKLRTGDRVVCRAARCAAGECPAASLIMAVNGIFPDDLRRIPFEDLTPCYPDKRYSLGGCTESLAGRVIDLFAPIGNGQRALIVAAPHCGKTELLRHIALSFVKQYPQTPVIAALVGARPEDITEFRRTVNAAECECTAFDGRDTEHIRAANLALERAKRLAEEGKDAVLILDGLNTLVRAYATALSPSGRQLPCGIDAMAFAELKRIFGAARNTEEGGSLTVIAAVVCDTGSPVDETLREELLPAANMRLILSPDLAAKRVFPAIDLVLSGTRRDDLLLSSKEIAAASAVRSAVSGGADLAAVYAAIGSARSGEEFIEDWQKYLKNT